jgi:hypothetical protein
MAGALYLLVPDRHLYLIPYFEVYLSTVSIDVPVFFILDFGYELLCFLDSLVYTDNYSLGSFLAEAFWVRGRGRGVPVERDIWRAAVN